MRMLCVLFILSLVGCDRFRYPCQDPENWEKKECKRPFCSATGTCPDQLTKPEEIKDESPKVSQPVPCNDTGTARCGN